MQHNLKTMRVTLSPTSARNVLRADRDGRLLLRPDFDVKRMLTVKALIDRITFTVDTNTLTSRAVLKAEIDRRCDVNAYGSGGGMAVGRSRNSDQQ